MLTLKNIVKRYRTESVETKALNRISLNVGQGEFVAIMGQSGCGKSTLLNTIGMLDQPSDGQYLFDGEDVSKYSERRLSDIRKANIGFVFQSFNLIDELTVFENIELPLIYQKVKKAERQQRVMDVLQKVGIAHRKDHFPQQLSGGQQQRVAVGRALICRPKLILADEPTGNLDSKNGEEVMEMLTKLNQQGATIVMVTHSDAHADYANRVIHLFDGNVVTEQMQETHCA